MMTLTGFTRPRKIRAQTQFVCKKCSFSVLLRKLRHLRNKLSYSIIGLLSLIQNSLYNCRLIFSEGDQIWCKMGRLCFDMGYPKDSPYHRICPPVSHQSPDVGPFGQYRATGRRTGKPFGRLIPAYVGRQRRKGVLAAVTGRKF